ncbi:hypothetical protein D3C83_94880 [compost metagenome]
MSVYQRPSVFGSFALMKMPPMPVTRSAGKAGASFGCACVICPLMKPATKIAATMAVLMLGV